MKKVVCTLFTLSLILSTTFAQSNDCDSMFIRQLGVPSIDEYSFDLISDQNNDFWITGNQGTQSILLKVNANGELLEQLKFDMTLGNDFFRFIQIDSDNMVVVNGRDQLNSDTENFIVKLDPNNNEVIWSKKFPNPTYSRFEQFTEKSIGGNYICSGSVYSAFQGVNIFLMEVDRNTGNLVWQKEFNVGNTDVFTNVKIHDNYIYASGFIRDGNTDKIRPILAKLDFSGNIIWTKYYLRSLNTSARLYGLDLIINNNKIVTCIRGSLNNSNLSQSRAYVLETDLNGNLLTAKQFNPINNTPISGLKIFPTTDNGYVLRGSVNSSEGGLIFAKLDDNFNVLWSKRVDTQGGTGFGTSIINNDLFFATASAKLSSTSNQDIYFGKINLLNPEPPFTCDWFYDFDMQAETLTNFSSNITLIETNNNHPLNNFTVVPSSLSLNEENACECSITELCDNNIDDDNDGLTDCNDPDLADNCCCLSPTSPNLGNDLELCEGENILLNTQASYETYTWQDGSNDESLLVNTKGTYTISVTDSCGVVLSDTIIVYILDAPITFDTILICEGDTINIFDTPQTQSGNYTEVINAENGCDSTHQVTLQVVETLHSFETLQICLGDSIAIFGNQETLAGNYTQLLPSQSGCDSIHTITLEIIPPVNIQFETLPTCNGTNNGFVKAIPTGGLPPYSFAWENSLSNTDTLENLSVGNYQMTITDGFGCLTTANFNIDIIDNQPIEYSINNETCFGENDGFIEIINSSSFMSYSLDGIQYSTITTFDSLSPQTYTLYTLMDNSCEQTIDLNIELGNELTITLPTDTLVCLGDSISIVPQINNVSELLYTWSPNEVLSCLDCANPTMFPMTSSTLNLLVVDENGCTDSSTININLLFEPKIYSPNVFSPNNDGLNDYFFINTDKSVKQILELNIFDRWGELVFKNNNFMPNISQEGWDGTLRGQLFDSGVFTWYARIQFWNNKVQIFSGSISILK